MLDLSFRSGSYGSGIIYIRPGIRTFFHLLPVNLSCNQIHPFIFWLGIPGAVPSGSEMHDYRIYIFRELWWFWFSGGGCDDYIKRARVNYFASDWSVCIWTSTISRYSISMLHAPKWNESVPRREPSSLNVTKAFAWSYFPPWSYPLIDFEWWNIVRTSSEKIIRSTSFHLRSTF